MPSCLPQSSLRFPLVTLCVQECGLSVCWCVCMCLCVCDWECASVFRRCCFPQPWSNSVVTQSPCERFPASVLPPVDSLSLAGWVAECVWQRPAQSHWNPPPPFYPPSHQDWFTMSTVGAVGSSDARSRACILCAHHPDILYLSFNNCCREVCICACAVQGWDICVGHMYVWDHHILLRLSKGAGIGFYLWHIM